MTASAEVTIRRTKPAMTTIETAGASGRDITMTMSAARQLGRLGRRIGVDKQAEDGLFRPYSPAAIARAHEVLEEAALETMRALHLMEASDQEPVGSNLRVTATFPAIALTATHAAALDWMIRTADIEGTAHGFETAPYRDAAISWANGLAAIIHDDHSQPAE